MIGMIEEGFDLGFEVAGKEIVFQQGAVLEGLVPAFDLALSLEMMSGDDKVRRENASFPCRATIQLDPARRDLTRCPLPFRACLQTREGPSRRSLWTTYPYHTPRPSMRGPVFLSRPRPAYRYRVSRKRYCGCSRRAPC